eukprot:gene11238-13115_t
MSLINTGSLDFESRRDLVFFAWCDRNVGALTSVPADRLVDTLYIVIDTPTLSRTNNSNLLLENIQIVISGAAPSTTIDFQKAARFLAMKHTGSASITLNGLTLLNGYAATGGGFISIEDISDDNLDVIINDCVFQGGEAEYGGAINFQARRSNGMDLSLTLTRATFTENEATNHHAAVYTSGVEVIVDQCTFTNNTGDGLIKAFHGKLALTSTIVADNACDKRPVISLDSPQVTLRITNCTITNTHSSTSFVVFSYQSNVAILSSTISDNLHGPIVSVNIGYSITITSSHISNNVNDYYGSIFAPTGTVVTINNSTMFNNTGREGSAIWAVGADIRMDNCVLKENEAEGYGGAIFFKSSSLNISNSLFTDNSAFQGHDLYCWDSSISLVMVTNENGDGIDCSKAFGMGCLVEGDRDDVICNYKSHNRVSIAKILGAVTCMAGILALVGGFFWMTVIRKQHAASISRK